jgi:hypothetical protein
MGYTNYWTLNKVRPVASKKLLAQFASKTIELSGVNICGWDGYQDKPTIKTHEISLNGCEADDNGAHESFVLYQDDLCKTARKPYDVVVKSILICAKHLGIVKEWSHDDYDNCEEYTNGLELFNKTNCLIKLLDI